MLIHADVKEYFNENMKRRTISELFAVQFFTLTTAAVIDSFFHTSITPPRGKKKEKHFPKEQA